MPIEDFWGWWASAGRAAAEAGIGGAGFKRFTPEMTMRVNAIHPDLGWELTPGGQAEHALIVTAAGVPERRRMAAIVHALVAVPAKWVDRPLMDQHIAVTLPFADQTPEGLPGPGAAVCTSPDAGWRGDPLPDRMTTRGRFAT